MKEITTKFKSCFENDTIQRDTIIFKTEDGTELGRVNLRQLKDEEITNLKDRPVYEWILQSIESWTFSDPSGTPLPLDLKTIKSLTSQKKVGKTYEAGILDVLGKTVLDMNFVSEAVEKNSAGQ